jgi:GGDEF domain-containing protein
VSTLEQLLKWTDMAMYHAKDAGRNMIRFLALCDL